MGELSFVVITTYDSEEIATAVQQRIAEIWKDATEMPMQIVLNAGWSACKFLR